MKTTADRVLGLDLLRGFCAVGVAIYHTLYWSDGPKLHGLGLYGVYVFFVLSGASLYIAYSDKIAGHAALVEFMGHRLFRLVPLMAIVALAVGLRFDGRPLSGLWLTASMLLGFANPGATSIVDGAWSLGIEFVFYLAFPVLCAFSKQRSWWLVAVILFVSQRIYVEAVLSKGGLVEMWVPYTQPLSFASYFFVGCCIGRALVERRLDQLGVSQPVWWTAFLVLFTGIALALSPTPERLLLGLPAIVLTLVTYLVVLASAQLRGGRWFKSAAAVLGDISYGMYLLHPLVWALLERYGKGAASPAARMVVCIGVSATLAWISNRYFEMPIRRLGYRVFKPSGPALAVRPVSGTAP